MDASYVEFWRDVRSLAFAEVPDYDGMKRRFVDYWIRKGYEELPGEIDWWAADERIRSRD
jgi:casein kinase I family protein HRR25